MALLGALVDHWHVLTGGVSLLGLVPIGPRLYRRLARWSDCQWHLSQCTDREAALTREVTYLHIAIRDNLDARYGGGSSGTTNGSPTTPTATPSSKISESSGA